MTITVADLIERLKECDPNAIVRARDFTDAMVPMENLKWDVYEWTKFAAGADADTFVDTTFVDIEIT